MDVWILDRFADTFKRVEVFDGYISAVWTERYRSWGDFEIVTSNNREVRNLFEIGTFLTVPGSEKIARVDTVERDGSDEDILIIKGRTLEYILEERVAVDNLVGLATQEKWKITDTPRAIAATLWRDTSTSSGSAINSNDIYSAIPYASIYSEGSIPFNLDEVTLEIEPEPIYGVIQEIASVFGFGFRVRYYPTNGTLRFQLYTGDNRTSSQTALPAVIFSEDLDGLSGVKSVKSVASYRNVAYVLAKNGAAIVYADGVDATISEFDRKVTVVKANDIDLPAGEALDSAMIIRGRQALAATRQVLGFDGEIPQHNAYIYGVDYGLGDMVEIRDEDGNVNTMYVTEQIFVSDQEGFRSYPTLTFDQFLTANSWYGWSGSLVWDDLLNTGDPYWDDV